MKTEKSKSLNNLVPKEIKKLKWNIKNLSSRFFFFSLSLSLCTSLSHSFSMCFTLSFSLSVTVLITLSLSLNLSPHPHLPFSLAPCSHFLISLSLHLWFSALIHPIYLLKLQCQCCRNSTFHVNINYSRFISSKRHLASASQRLNYGPKAQCKKTQGRPVTWAIRVHLHHTSLLHWSDISMKHLCWAPSKVEGRPATCTLRIAASHQRSVCVIQLDCTFWFSRRLASLEGLVLWTTTTRRPL